MKRSCLSKLPKRIKAMSSSPEVGLQIGPFLLAQTILMPLLLVGSDILSDGGVLGEMWPYARDSQWIQDKLPSTGAANSSSWDEAMANEERNTTVNGTGVTNSTAIEQKDNLTEDFHLFGLFSVSITVLIVAMFNLFVSNPLATLVRNARTTVMMNSRELEGKDVPVPLGNNLQFNHLIYCSLSQTTSPARIWRSRKVWVKVRTSKSSSALWVKCPQGLTKTKQLLPQKCDHIPSISENFLRPGVNNLPWKTS